MALASVRNDRKPGAPPDEYPSKVGGGAQIMKFIKIAGSEHAGCSYPFHDDSHQPASRNGSRTRREHHWSGRRSTLVLLDHALYPALAGSPELLRGYPWGRGPQRTHRSLL